MRFSLGLQTIFIDIAHVNEASAEAIEEFKKAVEYLLYKAQTSQ
jgi:hypothetical protein